MLKNIKKALQKLKDAKAGKTAGILQNNILGVVFAILGVIIVLLIVGNDSMVTLINDGLTGICNSGWPLAALFNPTGGIVPLLIVVGLFVGVIAGALAIGKKMNTSK